jgi:hypothetical protein
MRVFHCLLTVALLNHNVVVAGIRGYQIHNAAALGLGSLLPDQASTPMGLRNRSTDVPSPISKNPDKANFLHARQSTDTGALYCKSDVPCIDGR